MKIYTKSGDKGETGLVGGMRVPKDCKRVETYGTIDEVNGILGIAISFIIDEKLKFLLMQLQNELFKIGAVVATPVDKNTNSYPAFAAEYHQNLEKLIDTYSEKIKPLRKFILPGGTPGASYLHFARTVCRRAERLAVSLSKEIEICNNIIIYLNRLSDLFFVLARYENFINNSPDIEVKF